MAITVTPLLNFFPGTGNQSDCDSATNWSAGTLDTGIYKQGTAAMGISVSNTTSAVLLYTCTSTDMTASNRHLYAWLNSSTLIDSQANGGLRMICGSDASNYRTWYVGGADTYAGGWQCFVVNPQSSGSISDVGTPNMAAVTRVGVQFKTLRAVKAGLINCFWDALRYGTGLQITSLSSDTITFDNIYTTDDSSTNAYGIISKLNSVFYVQGELIFGSTTAGQHIVFSDSNQVVVFKDQPVDTDLYRIRVQGNSTGTINFQLGTSTGSGSSQVGAEGAVIKSASTSLPFEMDFASNYIDNLKLYGSSFINPGIVYVGSTSTVLGQSGSTIELVDNNITNPTQVIRNISGSATTNILNNSIVSATSSRASMNLYDGSATSSSAWTVVEGKGFENSNTATTTTVTGEPFPNTAVNKPYVSVLDNASAVWNLDNVSDGAGGRISVTDQTEIVFDGNSNGDVNERFSVTWKVEEPDGDDINLARVKILETSPSVALANQDSTNATGDATSTYLRALYEPNGASTLTTTTHTPAAFKTYKYGKLPSISSATINQALTNNVAMLPDTFQVEATEATAVADGTQKVVIVESAALNQSHSIIKFTAGTGTLNVGNTVTGVSSGADGVVEEIIEGNSTAGTIILKTRDTNSFTGTETLNESGGSSDWSATYTASSEKRFYWLIQAGTISGTNRTIQELYDHFNAKLAESPIDTADNWDDVVFDGRAEYGTPVQGVSLGSPNSLKTIRNATLTHGWVVSGLLSLLGVNSYTANDGTLFTPQSTVTLSITVKNAAGTVIQNAQTAIYKTSDDSELMNQDTNGSGVASTTFIYTADTPIYIRVRKSSTGDTKYVPNSSTGTIASSGFSSTITLLTDTNA